MMRYERRNEYLCHVLASVAAQCRSTKELMRRLRTYGITLKRRGSTVSVLPQGGRWAVQLRTLGLAYAREQDLQTPRLKYQYVTCVVGRTVYFRKCACCGKWFAAYHPRPVTVVICARRSAKRKGCV